MVKTAAAQRRSLIGVMALFFLVPTAGFVTSDIQNIATATGVAPATASWVATINSLIMIPVTITAGTMVGRRVSYRTLAIVGMIIYTVAGIMPLFTGDNFALLLVARALIGVGMGLFATLSNSLVVTMFDDEKERARMLGVGNMVFSLGSVFALVLGGFLADISWQAPFYAHLVGVVGLVLVVLFLREPPAPAAIDGAPESRSRVAPVAFVPMIAFMIVLAVAFPLTTMMSTVFEQANLGSPSLVGLVTALTTVAGFVVSLLFGSIYRLAKNYVLAISSLVLAVGLLIVFLASAPGSGSLPVVAVGTFIAGAGLMGVTVGTPMVVSTMVAPTAAAAAQGLVAAFMNVGAVLSSLYSTAVIAAWGGADGLAQPIYLVSAVALAVLAILLAIAARRIARTAARPLVASGTNTVQ